MSEKTPEETSEQRMVRQPHGGSLQVGNPGNKGGGRPKDQFRAQLRELVNSEEAMAFLRRCLEGHEGARVAVQAHRYAAELGYGKLPVEVEVGPKLSDIDISRLPNALIARIAEGENPYVVLASGAADVLEMLAAPRSLPPASNGDDDVKECG